MPGVGTASPRQKCAEKLRFFRETTGRVVKSKAFQTKKALKRFNFEKS